MNYREKIKEAIKCPRLGNSSYGEWGALRYEQRVLIKRLLDELDDTDNLILMLKKEKQELIDYLKEEINECKLTGGDEDYIKADAYEEILSKIEKE